MTKSLCEHSTVHAAWQKETGGFKAFPHSASALDRQPCNITDGDIWEKSITTPQFRSQLLFDKLSLCDDERK